jgi:hypothetical protein
LNTIGLAWFRESYFFHQCLINFSSTHTCGSLLPVFTMSRATTATVHVIAQKITDTTHVTNKGSISLIQSKYKIYIKTPIRVLFRCLIYTHNIFKKLASFICAYFINFRFNVCVLAAVIIGICSAWYFEDLFSFREWKQLFTQKYPTNYQTYFENQLNNLWTRNNSMLMKYHTGESAEWIRILWTQFRGQVFGTSRLTALNPFPETVFSSDHNNNLKWAILGTKCACLLPGKDFFNSV